MHNYNQSYCSQLFPGDQIAAQYDFLGLPFWHHGIAVSGDHRGNLSIIDFGSNVQMKGISRSKNGPDLIELKSVTAFRKDPDNTMIRVRYYPGNLWFSLVTDNSSGMVRARH